MRIAIDDFGTGYSSLGYIQQFPVDALKIDRSFMSGVSHNPESAALIHTMIQLGKTLGIETLAEGIEDRQPAAQPGPRAVRQRPGLPARPPTHPRCPRRAHQRHPPSLGNSTHGHRGPGG